MVKKKAQPSHTRRRSFKIHPVKQGYLLKINGQRNSLATLVRDPTQKISLPRRVLSAHKPGKRRHRFARNLFEDPSFEFGFAEENEESESEAEDDDDKRQRSIDNMDNLSIGTSEGHVEDDVTFYTNFYRTIERCGVELVHPFKLMALVKGAEKKAYDASYSDDPAESEYFTY